MHFRSALSTNGSSAGLYYNLAMAEQKSGRRAEAALSLRRALTLDPRMIDAQIALSEIERSQGVPLTTSSWREIVAERAPIRTLLIVRLPLSLGWERFSCSSLSLPGPGECFR